VSNHFAVVEAENAASALRAFETTPFDAVIVDILLGSTCGFDLISAMREQKPFRPAELLRAISSAREAVSSRRVASA